MKIKVKKVKLTKSAISQMLFISTKDIDKAEVVGMLVNVRKNYPKLMLLYFNNDYYLYDMRWKCGAQEFYFTVSIRSYIKKFNSEKECKFYWKIFTRARNTALKHHIYV